MKNSHMKTKIKILVIVSICFCILTGCPYETEYSLSDSKSSKIDSALLGKWIGTEINYPNDTVWFQLFAFNKNEYYMEYSESGKLNDKNIGKLRCFETIIDGVRLMNITEIGEAPKFSYFNFKLEDKLLKVSYISDEFIKQQFDNQNKLLDFVKENINNSSLFESNFVFKKMN